MIHSYKRRTLSVYERLNTDKKYGSVLSPLYLTSTYSFKGFNKPRKYNYSRKSNPTRDSVQKIISLLKNGLGCILTSSRMAVIYLTIIIFLKPGDLIICPKDCYGDSFRLFKSLQDRGIYKIKFIAMYNKKKFLHVIKNKPKLIFMETPSNLLLRVINITYYCHKIKYLNALSVVYNTLLSSLLQNSLNLGANIVIHSCTKYLNGNSDIIIGTIITKNLNYLNKLLWCDNNIGITSSIFDSYLLLRGMRTLYPRLKIAQKNTLIIIEFLKKHKLVKKIYHPSIIDNIGHEIAKKQQKIFGAVLSFEFNGSKKMLKIFLHSLKLFTLAESFGGMESLISHSSTMTYSCITPKEIKNTGISNSLLRLSIIIENPKDLIEDLKQSFYVCIKNLE
ncbi:O-succinylhomoserine (thiol)-lyase [Enterobacteriaceae endosymbiont of Donacia provostii]|uniref:PLP-dependent transferase n=1 Tax=Enterobacteriaceae endosymbiont of Donacia provostii TaxID=2675781 RepID=UPI001448D20D|nr:PLP-dependent transferase [Enterobacteriaceae endosymbiont of Donacia provostii]QJC33518.1 O-succinylhomoserine (thiol)-lyase [Enterobacteriaceae endosymbiont of Donacia provostii]